MFIDRATITIKSGKGGDGHVAFLRYKYIPKGGPSGGNGGDGGDVYFLADSSIDTLLDFAGRHLWEAESGGDGGKKQCAGKDGENLDIKVPVGTLIYDDATGELLGDLEESGKRILVAVGGRGGFGNEHFATPTNQAPREASPGYPAIERKIRLELKLIADVGIVGKPNAGKSTLLSRVSKATPKIADYPFTTLVPQLGIAELSGYRRVVVADIPGLIEGAHDGHGLGTQFLRHIERTRLLVHLLEIEPADGSNPTENYRVVRTELSQYSPELAAKPEIVVLSKMDLLATDADRTAAKHLIEESIGKPTMTISSATGLGLSELLQQCWTLLHPQ